MLKSILALTVCITFVTANVVVTKSLGRDGKGSKYDGEQQFDNVVVFGYTDPFDDNADPQPLWVRPSSLFNLRYKDKLYIVPGDSDGGVNNAITLSKDNFEPSEETFRKFGKMLDDGNRFILSATRSDGNGGSKSGDFGWIIVSQEYAKYLQFQAWKAQLKAPQLKAWQEIPHLTGYSDYREFLQTIARASEKKYKNSAEAMKKLNAQKAQIVAQNARYADDGDYYGYAGDVAGEDYGGEQDIDASRLIEYAYKMGKRAGFRKQRNDYYYR